MAGGTGRWIFCTLTGWLGGYAWSDWGWPGVVALIGAPGLAGVALAWRMRRLPRLHPALVPEMEPAEPAN